MVLKKVYDEKNRTQKVWYDSSMIFYSEMIEDEHENKGDLYVTFKTGAIYRYKDVKFEDYVLFVGGGTDASQGKTLNKIIKNKYEVEKAGEANLELLREEMNRQTDDNVDIANTYFISGHRDITEEEFECYYQTAINAALHNNPNAKFVVGDFNGVDIMAQNYLMDILSLETERVTVYHMFDSPRNANPLVTRFKGGFSSDEDRDAAMTKASAADIAFVRNHNVISGTARNVLRRIEMKSF